MQHLLGLIHTVLVSLSAWTGSYGLAILAMTAALRAVMLPAYLWQQKASRKSAAMQAEVKEIQAEYEGEEQKRRLQEVYSKSGGRMLAGCLPTLLQWPVFLAMYRALSSFAIAVPAGFLWLADLSVPDPLFILPVLAVVTSGWQVLATAPPAQRKTAFIFPLLMGFIVLKASAAVALYWVASNLFTLAQHYFINRRLATA